MYDVRDFLERALQQQKNLLKIYEKRLKDLPEGSLWLSKSKGKVYYSKYQDGTRIYLGNNSHKEVQSLQLRKVLEETSSRMQYNKDLIAEFLTKYQDPSPQTVKKSLSKAYQSTDSDLLFAHDGKQRKGWADRPYQKNAFHPEKLTHKTLRGDSVRSKSEVIIANNYFAKGIPYRYEELIKVGGKTFAPDFSILVPRLDKVKYHEHFGMMYDPEYRARATQKMGDYIAAGFQPYEDIIFTFDDLDGNIDAQILDVLIQTCMM